MTDKPTAYGYTRVLRDASDDEVRALEEQIQGYAERCGLGLRGPYEEHGSALMLDLMAQIVPETNAKHVTVSSLENLSTGLAVQVSVIQMIHATGATLHNVSGAADDTHDAQADDRDQ